MGYISREAYKKLALLYLVSLFKEGVYSSYRLQKVLYFGTKDARTRPFLFRHTKNGQYSKDAKDNLEALVALGLLQMSGLPRKEDTGTHWSISPDNIRQGFLDAFSRIADGLPRAISDAVNQIGYLTNDKIRDLAEGDSLLKQTPFGKILFDANLPPKVEVDLPDEQCEDIELSLNRDFIGGVSRIVTAIEETDFDLGKVKIVGSIL